MHLPYVVGNSPTLHIRGMIACEDIQKGGVIERCPVIRIPHDERPHLYQTKLKNYYFEWTKTHDAIVLGYGSLINHSFTPNAAYRWDFRNNSMAYFAIRDIKKQEEVFINYNGDPEDMSALDPGLVNFS